MEKGVTLLTNKMSVVGIIGYKWTNKASLYNGYCVRKYTLDSRYMDFIGCTKMYLDPFRDLLVLGLACGFVPCLSCCIMHGNACKGGIYTVYSQQQRQWRKQPQWCIHKHRLISSNRLLANSCPFFARQCLGRRHADIETALRLETKSGLDCKAV